MPSKPIDYKGKRYESKAALCQEYGIRPSVFQNRLKSGWSLEEALETVPSDTSTNGTVVFYDGIRYPSVKSLAKELELPYASLQHYYTRRGDIEEAVTCCRKSSEQVLKLWGKEYESLSEIAQTFGLSYYHLATRMREGRELREVVKNALSAEPILFHGKQYESLIDLCSEYQIQPTNVYGRLGYGFTLEEALTRPVRSMGKRNTISYQGEEYESKIALCREYGVSYGTVREQMRTNPLDFLEAFDVFVQLKERIDMSKDELLGYIPHCRFNGRLHKNMRPLFRELGITPNAFYTYKYKKGYDNVFDALKAMQAEKREAYLVDGIPVFNVDLRKKYTARQIEEMNGQKIQVPRYPTLQNLDFDTGCCDTEQVYYEILNNKLQVQKEAEEVRGAEEMDNLFLMNQGSYRSERFGHLLRDMQEQAARSEVQTVGDFLQKHSGEVLSLLTPGGYVNLSPEEGRELLSGEAVWSHPGNPEYAARMEAEELLQLVVLNAEESGNVWYLLTDRPKLEQSEPGQEVQMC